MATKPVPPKSEISLLDQLVDEVSAEIEKRLEHASQAKRNAVTRDLRKIANRVRASSGKQR